ncbi:MAG: transglycosylase SLT domain-containing protein [Acetobacteraceae bacterium]|nr:transglycosylase SLT domain-containing protein [Acetobacteraceae bacterium]
MAITALALASATGTAQARGTDLPGPQCEDAIGTAARMTGIPVELMSAIALVESGRPDDVSGRLRPWPWTINAEGKGLFFNSKAEAIAAVRVLQADGIRSIDVGCMQVNLMHHPDAFASLDEAFEPRTNANYAGRFLNELSHRSADWLTAAGLYHSATPDLAADYVKRVAAVLHGGKGSLAAGFRVAALTDMTRPAAPVIGKDGTILPSMRLTGAGLVRERAVPAYLTPIGGATIRSRKLTSLKYRLAGS